MNAPRDSRDFYDALAAGYDGAIARCVPRYGEMLDAILRYLPDRLAPRRIVELGCGGGNLTRRLLAAFPEAEIHAVDFSRAMLEQVARDAPARLHPVHGEFGEVEFEDVDLVSSSIAIHHLDDGAKRALFARIRTWLRPGGVFCYSDQFRGESDETYARQLATWKDEAAGLGASEREWTAWMDHQEAHDHHAPLRAQLRWLEEAGFDRIDCVWRYLLWTVILAEAPSAGA